MEFINKRITVFGDSIGKGITTNKGKIEMLPTCAIKLFEDEYGINIENFSAYGNSLKRLVLRGKIEKYIDSLDKNVKNIAVIELGGNDADFDWQAVAANPSENHNPKTEIEEFSALYKTAYPENFTIPESIVRLNIDKTEYENNQKLLLREKCDKDSLAFYFSKDNSPTEYAVQKDSTPIIKDFKINCNNDEISIIITTDKGTGFYIADENENIVYKRK